MIDHIIETKGAGSRTERAWFGHIARWAPHATALPKNPFQRDNAAIDRLMTLGLDLDRLLDPDLAAAIWLGRGARYGEGAFRKRWSLKSPVVAYWETEGLVLPGQGFCLDGAGLMADRIRSISTLPPTVWFSSGNPGYDCSWQILLALLVRRIPLPHKYMRTYRLGEAFGKDRTRRIEPPLRKPGTVHAAIARKRALSRLPSTESLLLLPRQTDPSFLDPFLPIEP